MAAFHNSCVWRYSTHHNGDLVKNFHKIINHDELLDEL